MKKLYQRNNTTHNQGKRMIGKLGKMRDSHIMSTIENISYYKIFKHHITL